MSSLLQTPIDYLKGVGTNRADLLRTELDIHTFQDLLNFFPYRYIDKTKYYKINELQRNSADVQVIGKITHIKTVEQKRGKRLVADFIDDTGKMELVWFRGHKWIKENLKLNTAYVIYGKVNHYNGTFSMPHPEMEPYATLKEEVKIAMQPVYSSTEKLTNKGITQRFMGKMMQQVFIQTGATYEETLAAPLREELKLISKTQALRNIHFPKNSELLAKAQFWLKFEELFYIQLQMLSKNLQRKQRLKGFPFDQVGEVFNDFYENHLPFELTNAQKRVIKEIRNDLGSSAQMNRLLQGDVGSGKTIVALMCVLLAIDNNFQAVLMAPTEILAQQHYQGIKDLVAHLDIKVNLLTGSVKKSDRTLIHEALEDGTLNLLIGTHAVLEDKVQFKNLGLAIIDEQHRFGVHQRFSLLEKGGSKERSPHQLIMTATPIPRTLSMTVYGALDTSVIDELPPGRRPVETASRPNSMREKIINRIEKVCLEGQRAFWVCTLIEDSDELEAQAAEELYKEISHQIPKIKVGLVHGRLKKEEKDKIINKFRKGEIQLLVCTTVIEVGVDVPEATLMIIENPERLGLAQLHQLRGRVGRKADTDSYCLLLYKEPLSPLAQERIKTMEETNDGFVIAEKDLELRGGGDIHGLRQSGLMNLKIANPIRDVDLLESAQQEAFAIAKNNETQARVLIDRWIGTRQDYSDS